MHRLAVVLLTALALLVPALPAQADEAVATTTTLTVTSGYPQRVTFAAEVVAADGTVPTGTVQVREGEDLVATLTLVDGQASAETTATPGEHTYVATYVPDPATWASSTSEPQAVTVEESLGCFYGYPSKPRVGGQKVYLQGARPVMRIKVRTGNVQLTGTVTVRLAGPSTRWRKTRRYDGGTLELRGPRLREVGTYHVVLWWRPDPARCVQASKSESNIVVRKRRR